MLAKNTQDQVGLLVQMLTGVNQEKEANTSAKKDFILRKLGVLTNGKLGEDPNNPSIVVEPSNSNSGPCVICGEKTSGKVTVETPAKYTTAIKDSISLLKREKSSNNKS